MIQWHELSLLNKDGYGNPRYLNDLSRQVAFLDTRIKELESDLKERKSQINVSDILRSALTDQRLNSPSGVFGMFEHNPSLDVRPLLPIFAGKFDGILAADSMKVGWVAEPFDFNDTAAYRLEVDNTVAQATGTGPQTSYPYNEQNSKKLVDNTVSKYTPANYILRRATVSDCCVSSTQQ